MAVNKRKTCWLISDSAQASSAIERVLADMGVEMISLYSLASTSATIDGLIEVAAKRADLVLAVITREHASPNIYYELGYAAALRKRIVVFTEWSQPFALDRTRCLVVSSDIDDPKAVRFAIERALSLPRPSKLPVSREISKPDALGVNADALLRRLRLIGDDAFGFEKLVAEALREGEGHRIVDSPHGPKDLGYDFLLWSDAIQPYLGNPLPVEAKLAVRNTKELDSILSRLSKAGSGSQAMWRLLVVKELAPDLRLRNPRYSNILIFSAEDLLSRLRTDPLSTVLVHERNLIVHGGG